ncbi:MAG TPA: DUF2283 domain-containing protein [Thermodesulfobacteriota bacterium]|nr:DUF2283 domain-containing protein [Thermodesulfobacteriota bacterium]
MRPVRITYDPEGDILYITFGQPAPATGYQLSDQVLLRVDPQTQRAAGLTIFNFSLHSRTTQQISLPGLEDPKLKSRLLPILASPPVTHFLRVIEGKQGFSAILLSPSLQEAVTG